MKNIVAVKPGSISKIDKEALSGAGVIVVEIENPEDLRLLVAEPLLSADELLYAAMKGVMLSNISKGEFVDVIAETIFKNCSARIDEEREPQ